MRFLPRSVLWLLVVAFVWFAASHVVSCGGGGGGAPPPVDDGDDDGGDPPPEPPPPEPPPTDWPPLDPLFATRNLNADDFTTAPACAVCHDNSDGATAMRDAAGRGVAPMDLWRATPMANSARDPFWRAVLSAEVATNPTAQEHIEGLCMRCHAPMAHATRTAAGQPVPAGLLYVDDDTAQLGLDGVSCTLCHQIRDEGLGTDESYTGGFVLGTNREIFAGHANPNPRPMENNVGFTPVYATHTGTSAMCATCHNLETHALDENGEPTGHVLLEQGPYFEWRNSVFNDEIASPAPQAASCVACHMPSTDEDGNPIRTKLAHNPAGGDFGPGAAPVRDVFHRHLMVGGNTLLPRLLRENRDALQPGASSEALTQVEADSRNLLGSQSGSVAVTSLEREYDVLAFTVRVTNRAGHKLPTSYPSRRAWLHVRVLDAQDALVFESGAFDTRGRLLDGQGGVLASEGIGGGYEPHRSTISAADQVQIYESVMALPDGTPTWRLLRGAQYVKDNRLLPEGWDPTHEHAARAGPRGAAASDADFVGGRDDVRYRVAAPAAAGPYRVEVALRYQVLKTRYLVELYAVDTREVASFRRMMDATTRQPETIASTTATER